MQKHIIRIGLDIGVASVGWAVYACDENGEPKKLLALGSRIFDKAEVPKTGGSLAADRRAARGLRRRLRRKAERSRRLRALFEENGIHVEFSGADVHELRARALDELVSDNDFARILYFCCKNRGFKSNRKSEESSKDVGKLIKSAKANDETLEASGYRTIGEYNYHTYMKDIGGHAFIDVRNHGGEYTHTVYRDTLEKELVLLFAAQRKFCNRLATEDVEKRYFEIFKSQRNYDMGPGKGSKYTANYKVSTCPYEGDICCPKASRAQEWSTSLQKLNNLRVVCNGDSRDLTPEERELALNKMRSADEVNCAQLRKLFKLGDDERFNIVYGRPKAKDGELTEEDYKAHRDKTEKSKVISSLKKSNSIMKLLSEGNREDAVIDEVAKVLSLAKSDDKRRQLIKESEFLKDRLSDEEIDAILGLNFDKFGGLGLIATRKIIPYLEQGLKYNAAIEAAGYKFNVFESERSALLNTKQVYDALCSINSPVVKRAVSQTIKVVNAIVLKYGSPAAISVELARDLTKPFEERKQIEADNLQRYEENERRRKEFENRFGRVPKKNDLLRLRLYEEQRGICLYSGDPIDNIEKIFEDNYYQVDHVLPFSKSFNDSYNNKVLVKTVENQRKGNKLPCEYMSGEQYAAYKARVLDLYKYNRDKRDILLKTKLDEDEWKSRALNDTRNIGAFMRDLLDKNLLFDDRVSKKKRVYAYNGAMTAYVRRNWGIVKVREDGDLHHAADAAVIACMTDSLRNKVERYSKYGEIRFNTPHIIDGEAFDPVTGEALATADRLPLPYPNFRKELIARTERDKAVMDEKLKALGYSAKDLEGLSPAFVSRMPIRKTTGQIHDATVRSGKEFDSRGVVISRVDITKLKLTKDGNDIDKYHNKEGDPALYRILLQRLQAADGDAAKAFKDPVYKPLKNGGNGPVVKKVKLEDKATSVVKLDKTGGVAANGGMVRVDIFKKGGQYYCVPVYMIDAYKGVLPNKAIVAHKNYSEWPEMDDNDFLFSLSRNDLVHVVNEKGIELKKIKDNKNSKLPNTISCKNALLYYNTIDISSGNAQFEDVTGGYECRKGLKTLDLIEKYEVDVLGNIKKVEREKRQPLRK